ncbi:MAG: polyphenol oxidase family protein, partial [Bacteroidales bacterium]
LTVSTADCVPVLLYCPKRQVVAAVHAGWRGMVKRIISKTVCRMVEQFGCDSADIRAAIGPSISPEAFEVGAEVALAFEEAGFGSAVLPSPIAGKAYIDLWHGAKSDLLAAGVLTENIETAAICTWQQHDRFFSARRLGIRSGRISSGIMLK